MSHGPKNKQFQDYSWFEGRNSSVGIVTRYGLDGSGKESRWRRDFLHRPDRPWGPPSLLYNGCRLFPEGKAAEAWRWPLTHSSVEVKERVQLYSNLPLGLRDLL